MLRRPVGFICAFVLAATLAAPARADPAPVGIGIGAAAVVAANLIFDPPDPDADRSFLNAGVGFFDPIDRDNTSAEFRVEYWTPWTWFHFRPVAGVFGTSDKGVGAYIGVRYDLFVTRRLVVTIETAPTLYSWGNGSDLGSFAVLRSGGGVAYRFDNASRISLTLHHMSHGRVFSDQNPGVETAAITFAIPIDRLFGN